MTAGSGIYVDVDVQDVWMPHTEPAKRAKALCWVLHLVGDLHQPLHCVALYDKDFPNGDRGGNSIKIADSSRKGANLHGLWDGILGQASDVVMPKIAAEQYGKENAAAVADRAKDLDAVHWVAEGRDLAMKVAYQGIELTDKGELLADVDRLNASPDREYLRRARDTARVQVALAGKRLAALLGK